MVTGFRMAPATAGAAKTVRSVTLLRSVLVPKLDVKIGRAISKSFVHLVNGRVLPVLTVVKLGSVKLHQLLQLHLNVLVLKANVKVVTESFAQ